MSSAALRTGLEGIDVVGLMALLVEGMALCKLFALLNDGDLLLLVKEVYPK